MVNTNAYRDGCTRRYLDVDIIPQVVEKYGLQSFWVFTENDISFLQTLKGVENLIKGIRENERIIFFEISDEYF